MEWHNYKKVKPSIPNKDVMFIFFHGCNLAIPELGLGLTNDEGEFYTYGENINCECSSKGEISDSLIKRWSYIDIPKEEED